MKQTRSQIIAVNFSWHSQDVGNFLQKYLLFTFITVSLHYEKLNKLDQIDNCTFLYHAKIILLTVVLTKACRRNNIVCVHSYFKGSEKNKQVTFSTKFYGSLTVFLYQDILDKSVRKYCFISQERAATILWASESQHSLEVTKILKK